MVNLGLFEHVGARGLGERRVLAVAEGGRGAFSGPERAISRSVQGRHHEPFSTAAVLSDRFLP